uniref:Heat shock protein kDa n=1 Tax=Echinococcus granulosus TaxID=6210 RepID=A0A068WX97_ECHGR|nr:heat shock protein kDa [Echinococcus granulosus]
MNSPVAIDLGDSFCRVGLYKPHDGRVRIVPDFEGYSYCCYSIPSYVAFVNNAQLVGTTARMQSVQEPHQTISRMKSLLGKRYFEVEEQLSNITYQVTSDIGDAGRPLINGQFYAEEIVAVLVNKMREVITHTAKQSVKDVVITVPPCFKDAQRQATLDAAEIAGVRVAAMLNETTAAAFVYAFSAKEEPLNVLFYDFGGGHVAVTVASVSKSEVRILGSAGSQKVSGNGITDRFTASVAELIVKQYNQDPYLNMKTYNLLRLICERCKRDLSSNLESELIIRGVLPDIPIRVVITRAHFEDMCQDLFKTAMEPIDEAIQLADLNIDDIKDVVILGGSARIPKVDLLLREKFHKRQINKRLHSEETVAYGAALYAAQLAKALPTSVSVYDVTNHTIAIEQPHRVVSPMIPRNTPIPCAFRRTFSTMPDSDQSHLTVRLYEGDRAKATDNTFLGSFDITELRPAFGDIHEAMVDFEVDKNGILKATLVLDSRWHQLKHVDIKKTCLPADFKYTACREFARSLSGDAHMRRLFEHRRYLEFFAYLLRTATGAKALDLQEQEVQCLLHESKASLGWLRSNPKAQLDETDAKIMSVQDTVTSSLRCTIEELVYHALHFTNPEGDIKYFPVDSEKPE